MFHGPLVMTSYLTYCFNDPATFTPVSALANMMGLHIYLFTAVALMNINWLVTTFSAIFACSISIYYYCHLLKYPFEAIGVSLILTMSVVVYTSYFCEKKFKLEFLQLKHNEQMHSDIRNVLENLPEGILLFKQAT